MAAITATNQTNVLVNSIIQRFDANGDGSLSANEFGAFLTQLVGSATTQDSAATRINVTNPSTLFATASAPVVERSRVGTMLGFDYNKLSDESHNTFKYQMGRILQHFPNTPEGLRQALPEIQNLVPGARITGTHGDKIDFGNYEDPRAGRIGVIDVLVGAADGGRGWAWQPVE